VRSDKNTNTLFGPGGEPHVGRLNRETSAEVSPMPYRTAGGRSFAPGEAPHEPRQKEKWHQRLIERFFSAPKTKDPMSSNGRLYFVLAIFLIGFAAVIGKLFKVQVMDHDEHSAEAASQYRSQVVIPARRGVIRDRNGVILATNGFVVKLAIDPQEIKNKPALASALVSVFGRPKEYYTKFLNDTSRRYIVIEREVPQEIAAKLDNIKERGLMRETEMRRHYAFGDRGSHIIGFSSKDGRGLAGLELFADKILRGKDGTAVMQRDGKGMSRPDVDYDQTPATNGDDITLTIDERIQSMTENALKAGVSRANAEAGIAIVLDPHTGEILSLANVPDFNPNDFFSASNEMLRNRAITDAFEPGSTMKVLTAAIALEEKAWKPEDKVNAEGGTWAIEGGAKIKDTHPYGILTFRQALEKSSNVSFAKISDKLERRRFYKYMRDFGFGVLSGVDLPGEIKGYLRKPDRWDYNSKRYIAFGYAMTATPIQMAAAYSAIANDGVMMRPYIISKRTNAKGETTTIEPQEIRRIVSVETTHTLRDIMRGVVDSGTGTSTKIKGVTIAGKTGTAQQLVNGHYSKEHYTSSFIGFFPAEKPDYEILVILRSPKNGYYGGAVSAPIFREITMGILDMNGKLPPEARGGQPMMAAAQPAVDEGGALEIDGTVVLPRSENDDREMPDVRGLAVETARSILASQGFSVLATEKKGVVEQANKFGGDSVRLTIRAQMLTGDEAPRQTQEVEMPDFIGMPMARAMKYAATSGLRARFVGDGSVTKQMPDAGSKLDARNPAVTLFGEE
jgi:cell division protein FtsI (penicillin-binding protein 3)